MTELAELKSAREEWNILVNKIESTVGKVQNPIKLDISGRVFKVSKETLMSIENTYFYGLVANMDTFKPLVDGAFFIERNPLVFGRILDYLRTGRMDIRGLTPYAIDMLTDDLDYYCIPLPIELQVSTVVSHIYWDIKKSDNCTLSNNNLTATKSFDDDDEFGVVGNMAVDRYTVKIDSRGDDGGVMIGFSTVAPWDINIDNLWYMLINVCDGSIHTSGTNNNDRIYSPEINDGDYITVIRHGTTIRLEKNNFALGACQSFTDIPDQSLFPCIIIYCKNRASVSLVNDY